MFFTQINYINSQHANIKFTHEIENNNTLPFLDSKILLCFAQVYFLKHAFYFILKLQLHLRFKFISL